MKQTRKKEVVIFFRAKSRDHETLTGSDIFNGTGGRLMFRRLSMKHGQEETGKNRRPFVLSRRVVRPATLSTLALLNYPRM